MAQMEISPTQGCSTTATTHTLGQLGLCYGANLCSTEL